MDIMQVGTVIAIVLKYPPKMVHRSTREMETIIDSRLVKLENALYTRLGASTVESVQCVTCFKRIWNKY